MHRRVLVRSLAMASAVALLTTACLSEGGDSGSSSGGGGGDETVEVMYGFSGDQSEFFKKAVNDWATAEGVTVKLSSTPDFDKLIRSRVAGNNIPDIAIFPQPGITLDIAKSGKMVDLTSVLDKAEYNAENIFLSLIHI